MTTDHRLKMRTKLGFGVGSVAEGAIYIAFNTWNLLFYNQVLGLSGTLAGLAVTISLILDGISEPLVGSLSDRWRSKLGRRHPFLYSAPIPLALSFYLLYSPPSGLSSTGLFLWFTLFATLHRQAMTLYQIPHFALGAELSSDYRQRSVVMSYATLFMVVGGSSTYFWGWTWFSKIAGGTSVRDGYAGMAAGVAFISALVILASAHLTRDQIPRLAQPAKDAPRLNAQQLWNEVADCLKNRNYLVLLLGLFVMSVTTGTRETINPYASLFFWELDPTKIRIFGLASPFGYILAFVLTVRFHARFDKRNTMIGSGLLLAFATGTPVLLRLAGLLPPNGSSQLLWSLMFFVFLFYLSSAVLMISVLSALADVADEHELSTGRRQEGIFYAARTFFAKLSTGFGHIVAGAALDLIAFPIGAKPGQVAHDVVVKLGILDGPIAALPALLALVFYGAYRIDRSRHMEIQEALALRRASLTPSEPGAGSAVHATQGAEPAAV